MTLPLDAVYVSLRAEHKAVHYSDVTVAKIWFSAGAISSSVSESELSEANAGTQGHEPGPRSHRLNIGQPVSEFRLKSDSVYRQPEVVTRKMELYEVVQRERLAVLLGAPGAGKTTLTRFVTARFAEACRAGKTNVTDKPGNLYGNTRLPILLRVASYAEALENNNNLSLRAFLSLPFHDTGIPDAERAAFFAAALQQGKALILLDGLDEVASGADRARIARQIESFVSGLEANCRVLVTSRIVGYREARLGSGFAEYQMLDMDNAQVQEFLNRWCVEVEMFQTPGAGETENRRKGLEESERLQAAIGRSEGVRKLATNPLLLTILALIHRNQKHLPERRVELYRMASDTLLREWRPAQTGMKNVEVTEAEAETLLLPLAYTMHNTVETGLLDREEARKLLCRFDAEPRGLSPKDPAVLERIDGFLKRVEEHSGLLVMHSTGTVGFLHLTFQEYFAARYLVNDFDEAKTLLRQHRHKARWEEPLRLAIATQTGANAAKLIRAALWHKDSANSDSGYEPSPHEAILRRDLLMTARCLGDCAAIEPTLAHEVANELTGICLNKYVKGKYEPLRLRVYALLPGMAATEIGKQMVSFLLAILNDKNQPIRANAAEALGHLSQTSDDVFTSLLAALEDENMDIRRSAAVALGQLGQGSEDVVSALLAALRDTNDNMQFVAADALGQLGQASEDVVFALLTAFQYANSVVRKIMARALGQIGQGSAAIVTTLLTALEDANWCVREGAVLTLGQLGQASEDVVNSLLSTLQDEYSDVREGAAIALGQLGYASEDVASALLAALQDRNRGLQVAAISALGQLKYASEDVVSALLIALEDDDEYVQNVAAGALGQLGHASEDVVFALLMALQSYRPYVQSAAVRALGQLGHASEAIVSTLLHALQDYNKFLRRDAAGALGKLGQNSNAVINALLAACQDKEANVRKSTAGALGQLGQASEDVLNTLLAALRDEDRDVRNAAWEALWTLTSDRAASSGAASA